MARRRRHAETLANALVPRIGGANLPPFSPSEPPTAPAEAVAESVAYAAEHAPPGQRRSYAAAALAVLKRADSGLQRRDVAERLAGIDWFAERYPVAAPGWEAEDEASDPPPF